MFGKTSRKFTGWQERKVTCMNAFVMITMTRELILGSLNSGFSSSPVLAPSGSVNWDRFSCKLEIGWEVGCVGSATSALDMLD